MQIFSKNHQSQYYIKDVCRETYALPGLFYLFWENRDLEGVLAWRRTISKSGRPSGFNIHIGWVWNCNKKSLSYVSLSPSCFLGFSSRSGKDASVEMEVTFITYKSEHTNNAIFYLQWNGIHKYLYLSPLTKKIDQEKWLQF